MATNKDFIVKNGLSVGGDVAITGNVTSDLHLNDNAKIKVGTATDGDLQIYHNVNNSFIEDVGTGSLYLRADASVRIQSYGDNNDMIKADKAGAVTLYHNNGSRLDTTASGVNVTGTVDMDGFTSVGNGTITGDVLIQKGSGFPKITLQDLDGTNTRAFIQYSANTLHLTSQNNTANGRIVFSRYNGTTTTTSGYFDATGKLFTSSDLDVSGNVASSGNISAVNTTLTGYLRGPASFTIDPAAHADNTGTVIIAGNLQVDGTQTTINSTSLTVDDLNLTLASGAADSAAANGAGITIDGASASLTYAHSGTKFVFNKPLDVTGNIGVTGTVDGVDVATRDAVLTGTTTTANAALPKAGGTMTGNVGIGIAPRARLDLMQQTNRTSKTGTTRGVLHLQDGDTPANNELTAITFESNSNNASAIIGQSLTNNGSSLFFGTSNSYGSGVTNTAMSIDHVGNVGIGTTSPLTKLNIHEGAGGAAGVDFGLTLSSDRYQADYGVGIAFRPENNSTSYKTKTAILASGGGYGYNQADLHFCIDSDNTITNEVGLADSVMTLKKGGNVGIGTDNPGCALDVTRTSGWAEMHLDGASGGDLILKDNNVSYGEIYAGNGHGMVLKSYASQDMYFLTNAHATSKMIIKSAGNVGIGTASPATKLANTATRIANADGLTVSTSGLNWVLDAQGYVAALSNLATSDNHIGGLLVEIGATGGTNKILDLESGGVNRVRVLGSGNVGIGETVPQSKLHVKSGDSGGTVYNAGYNPLVIETPSHGGIQILTPNNRNGLIYFGDNDSPISGRIEYLHSTDTFEFVTGGASRLTLNNVGLSSTVKINAPSFIPSTGYNIEYLIVGGGGGGGTTIYDDCGGGGAGGYRSSIAGNPSANYAPPEPPLLAVVGKTYAVTVGAGGNLLGYGNGSGFGLIESVGGGRAGSHRSRGAPGGSGGGGSGQYSGSDLVEGGVGYYGQGNNGGTMSNYSAAGGGGGAGAPGEGGSGSSKAGGAGVWSVVESGINQHIGSQTANRVYRAGGGGAYGGGAGGNGGGGRGWSSTAVPTAGAANTGGGGGGNKENHTYSATVGGGSGIVILKVPTSNYTGTTTGSPTVTTIGNYKILKFTSSGSYTA